MDEQAVLDAVRRGDLTQEEAGALLGRSQPWVSYRLDPDALERKRAYDRERFRRVYEQMTWLDRHRNQLRVRRSRAVQRVAARNARG